MEEAQWRYMREAPEILMTTKGLRIGNDQITILSLMFRSFLAHNASPKNVGGNKVADHLLKLFFCLVLDRKTKFFHC